jgi:hypothetical protein
MSHPRISGGAMPVRYVSTPELVRGAWGYRFVAASGVTGLPVVGAAGFASCVFR